MHPVSGEAFSRACLTLGNLVLMMREDQILSATMNIDLLTQIFLGHDRALNVPSRTALAPWRLPCRLALFLRFPENEIQRIFLLILTGYQKRTISSLQIIKILMGKLSVLCKFTGTIVNGSIFLVSIPLLDQL